MSQTIRARLSTWNMRFWFAISARGHCRAIEVRCLLPDDDDRGFLRKVCDAIDLVARYSPVRLARLRRDVRGLLITETAGNVGEYHHGARLCLLDRSHLLRQEFSAAHVAATIIHEATHARLRVAGFRYEPGPARARIENVCFRAEIAFASRLPDGGAIIEEARAQLARDPVVWTAEAARSRALTKFRELGVPEWLIRIVARGTRAG